MDTVDIETRSKIMSRVGQKGTGPEMKLRKALHARGLRYRVNVKKLPGSPDLVFKKYKAVVFVHGCFWHRHEGCKYTTTPKSREEFWKTKFKANVERDRRNIEALLKGGWRVMVVWECVLKRNRDNKLDDLLESIVKFLESDEVFKEVG